MDELADKLGALLKDEDSLKMITNIASGLMSGDDDNNSPISPLLGMFGGGSGDLLSGLSGLDANMLKKITHAVSSSKVNEDNYNLLMALKPHLSKKRSKKIDTALNMLKLSKMAMAFFEK